MIRKVINEGGLADGHVFLRPGRIQIDGATSPPPPDLADGGRREVPLDHTDAEEAGVAA